MPYGTVNADKMTTSDGVSSAGLYGLKNRIFNGDMRIDQRNAGASVTQNTTNQFPVDRWAVFGSVTSKFTAQRNAASVTSPVGFTNYLGITSSSAYTVGTSEFFQVRQAIEGFNVSDLAWGTASAATITLSFWIRSSLTGTFGGSLSNNAGNRSYPFSYTISAANTWEQKTVTIAGDTSGTWTTDNTGGLWLYFGLGVGSTYSGTAGTWAAADYRSATGATSVVGTNGATFYITGVQLEKGSTATSFDYRPYGTELQLCQRYLPCFSASAVSQTVGSYYATTTTAGFATYTFKATSRVPPTGITISNATHFDAVVGSAGNITLTALTFSYASSDACTLATTVASGQIANAGGVLRSSNASAQIQFTGCEL